MKKTEKEKLWAAFYGPNMGYIYDEYEKYKVSVESVDASFKQLFEEWGAPPDDGTIKQANINESLDYDKKRIRSAMKLLRDIRSFGHLVANIYPLENIQHDNGVIKLTQTKEELEQIPVGWIWEEAPPFIQNCWEAYNHLKQVYTGTIAFEFKHIHDEEERKWLDHYVENEGLELKLSKNEKLDVAKKLIEVENFEKFLQQTFVGQKRFSIEGLDILVPMLDKLIEESCGDRTENLFIGMAHRGRLNVLAHVLGKPYELIFSEFHHSPNKELVPSEGSRGINYGWSGDVKYHLGANREIKNEDEHTIHINLANNPSHLEFVNPVVQGMTRASQENHQKSGFPVQKKIKSLSVLIHGDAAFPGEGVVAETLNISRLKGYETGGTIHIIANNRIGFTTNTTDSRSTRYASDLAKGFEIPIIHVNADDPESCLAVIVFACQYRKKFNKDILIDLIGYRRFGHNEMDDPAATQPKLYEKINNHLTVAKKYRNELIAGDQSSEKEIDQIEKEVNHKLQSIYEKLISKDKHELQKQPIPITDGIPIVDTSVSLDLLQTINKNLLKWPKDFNVYPKLERILKRREELLNDGNKVDWALAETLAFASILSEGIPIRITGQDSERGTFAHRHLVLHDYKTNERYIPLHNIPEAKASFSIYNSPLSEVAVLGYEYGYSVQSQESLVIWEAQFGDFVNVAQPIIDQFIAAGRAKWGQKSSLVMLLPHGHEGQGPEHSSGRMERFLQSAAENNWIVANLTSSAQYFHILRRQALITDQLDARPLIIMTPKSLLRNSLTGSTGSELSKGQFRSLIVQEGMGSNPDKVKRLVLCSGKIAIDLASKIESEKANQELEKIQIGRVEQLYPFPKKEVQQLMSKYSSLEEVIWTQEEPKNMGAWPVIQSYLKDIVTESVTVGYIGRPKRSSPATGDPDIHKQEQTWILEDSLNVSKKGEQ